MTIDAVIFGATVQTKSVTFPIKEMTGFLSKSPKTSAIIIRIKERKHLNLSRLAAPGWTELFPVFVVNFIINLPDL